MMMTVAVKSIFEVFFLGPFDDQLDQDFKYFRRKPLKALFWSWWRFLLILEVLRRPFDDQLGQAEPF